MAGFDVLEQPIEVKRRVGYLPETPPLYPEMEVVEYLLFVGRLKGVARAGIARRVDEVCGLCAIGDVRSTLIAKLSKGYRQRVGLAQAIIHNPDILVLDEPTAGLDPKQIIETRELIKNLASAGAHTIILSTHILPEVEQTCQQVIIISKGKLVATDTVENLTHRLRGAESVAVLKDTKSSRLMFEVESLQKRAIRGDLARSVVEAGWNLNELRSVAMSLEEIFLQLTGSDQQPAGEGEK
jgi:ABC-2 type transport system ATP-binding protein